MVSDSNTRQVLIFGAVQITLSIATLEHVGMPILGLTLRGETNKEFNLISIMCGCAFAFFLFIGEYCRRLPLINKADINSILNKIEKMLKVTILFQIPVSKTVSV